MFINTKKFKDCEDEILEILDKHSFNINQAKYVLEHVTERLNNHAYIVFPDYKDGDLNGSIASKH